MADKNVIDFGVTGAISSIPTVPSSAQLLSASEWIKKVSEADSNAQFLRAADHAENALIFAMDDITEKELAKLQYLFVRAVVRSGAADRAELLYRQLDIARNKNVSSQALLGKILKDQALSLSGKARNQKFLEAAIVYDNVFKQSGASYPAVNAATLYLLAGDNKNAIKLANSTLDECENERNSYWKVATIIEAALVLGDIDKAMRQLNSIAELGKTMSYAELATTRKQLKLLCAAIGQDTKILDKISLPEVIFFAGHIIAAPGTPGRFPADEEQEILSQISDYFDNNNIGFAFGSLASGADILIAEECIRRGIELHAVLPFVKEDFIEVSVNCSGEGWLERFESVYSKIEKLERSDSGSITYATDGAYLGDDSLFGYCASFAMGLAMVRATNLDAKINMLAIFDGKSGPGFGTYENLERWEKFNLPSSIISPKNGTQAPPSPTPVTKQFPPREPKAILFGDIKGFSKLKEEMLPAFHSKVMYSLSQVLNSYKEKVLYSNTWGDAIYVVFDDPITAAYCGLKLQGAIKNMNFKKLGMSPALSLRLSGHYGPVFRGTDYVRNEITYFGSHVTKAARIEPVTPPGEIYVTEAFAAELALSQDQNIEYDYMGSLPTDKNFGDMRMYILKFKK